MDVRPGICMIWRKSSYSADTGNCIEVGRKASAGIVVRDSQLADSPELFFSEIGWESFVRRVKERGA